MKASLSAEHFQLEMILTQRSSQIFPVRTYLLKQSASLIDLQSLFYFLNEVMKFSVKKLSYVKPCPTHLEFAWFELSFAYITGSHFPTLKFSKEKLVFLKLIWSLICYFVDYHFPYRCFHQSLQLSIITWKHLPFFYYEVFEGQRSLCSLRKLDFQNYHQTHSNQVKCLLHPLSQLMR